MPSALLWLLIDRKLCGNQQAKSEKDVVQNWVDLKTKLDVPIL